MADKIRDRPTEQPLRQSVARTALILGSLLLVIALGACAGPSSVTGPSNVQGSAGVTAVHLKYCPVGEETQICGIDWVDGKEKQS